MKLNGLDLCQLEQFNLEFAENIPIRSFGELAGCRCYEFICQSNYAYLISHANSQFK